MFCSAEPSGCDSMVECQLPKLNAGVRFPSPAPEGIMLTNYNSKHITLLVLLLFLTGCGNMAHITVPTPREPGLYHKIRKGETLWRISRMYGIDPQSIAEANKLPNKERIYEGQLLFIPQGTSSLEQIQLAKEKTFIWPIKGKILLFYGGYKDDVKNKGIDIKARHGEAVVASRGGKVSLADENMKGFGKTIIVDHDDSYSTVYAHNSQILVSVGQEVRQGTVIAKAGQSGRAGSPRLHFEIRKGHKPQNPFYFLP